MQAIRATVIQPESTGLSPLSSLRERLAGWSGRQQGKLTLSDPEVAWVQIVRDLVDVMGFQKRQPGTIASEGAPCCRIALDCSDDAEPGTFETQIEPTDA